MSFDIGHLRFIDSFQFMASSLESLVENLVDEKATNKYHNFNNMDLNGTSPDIFGLQVYEWCSFCWCIESRYLISNTKFS